jgi:hypothetical protein
MSLKKTLFTEKEHPFAEHDMEVLCEFMQSQMDAYDFIHHPHPMSCVLVMLMQRVMNLENKVNH